MYSEKVMEHFRNPRNMGEIKDADSVGEVGNPVCGDLMYIYIKVKEENGKEIIDDISFQTFGCAAAIATSSMVTELAKGKPLDEALEITRGDVADSLDGLPPIKLHCSNLAADGLHDAIKKYREKNK
ncbi:MAG: Fe-S cluster assembly scaffold protein NifU [Promethearchaeota archaeon]|nr:MAG: Fe-S cluster assembly scaffold protein NifU [Candidatus Lokiarchaeota archaeon]